MDVLIPPSKCHECGYKMDMATSTRGKARPEAGDPTLCIRCGAVSIFDADLLLHKPSTEQLAAFEQDPVLRKVRILIKVHAANKSNIPITLDS